MRTDIYRKFADWIATGSLHLNAWMMLASPSAAEILADTSFDSVTIDMQHGQASVSDMMLAIAVVASADKPAFVRVPMGDLSLCSRALDAGARGVICPMIQNDSDARALSEATKFPPLGRRSWGAPRTLAMSGYTATEFLSAENTSCAALALIETMEALDHVPAILAIEGIDGLYVGPNDLSISLTNGAAIDIDHPSVQRICRSLAHSARSHGKIAGVHASTPEVGLKYAGYGFNFISIGTDIGFLRTQAESAVTHIRQKAEQFSEAL